MSDFRLVQNGYYQLKPNTKRKNGLVGVPIKLIGYRDKYSSVKKEVLKVGYFNPIKTGQCKFDITLWVHEVEPIPLTKDWLIRLDFKPWREHTYKRGGFIIASFKTETIIDDTRFIYHMTELKYVHQLQNMYFAVNYSELKYKV